MKNDIKKSIDELESYVDVFGVGTKRMFRRKIADVLLASKVDADWLYDDFLIKRKEWDKV